MAEVDTSSYNQPNALDRYSQAQQIMMMRQHMQTQQIQQRLMQLDMAQQKIGALRNLEASLANRPNLTRQDLYDGFSQLGGMFSPQEIASVVSGFKSTGGPALAQEISQKAMALTPMEQQIAMETQGIHRMIQQPNGQWQGGMQTNQNIAFPYLNGQQGGQPQGGMQQYMQPQGVPNGASAPVEPVSSQPLSAPSGMTQAPNNEPPPLPSTAPDASQQGSIAPALNAIAASGSNPMSKYTADTSKLPPEQQPQKEPTSGAYRPMETTPTAPPITQLNQTQSSGVPSGFIPTEAPMGEQQKIEASAGVEGSEGQKAYQNDLQNTQDANFKVQAIKDMANIVKNNPESVGPVTSYLVKNIDTNPWLAKTLGNADLSDAQVVNKFVSLLGNSGGGTTDLARAMSSASNPELSNTPDAFLKNANTVLGNAMAEKAKGSAIAKWSQQFTDDATAGANYPAFQKQWNAASSDRRVFEMRAMSPEDRRSYAAQSNLSSQDIQGIMQKQQQLKDMGAFDND